MHGFELRVMSLLSLSYKMVDQMHGFELRVMSLLSCSYKWWIKCMVLSLG